MINKPLVTIICPTYNHENYIRQCMDGFVMQKTSFPFLIIVHDDASTDRTADIIRTYEAKYPKLFANIYQTENQYSKGNCNFRRILFGSASSKYIALCEGDDYWIDPLKLQKQVDFLENNNEYGLVYTEFNNLNEITKIIEEEVFKNKLGYHPNTFEDFVKNGWFLEPCTWVFRKELISNFSNGMKGPGDIQILLHISSQSKVYFLKESTAIYRILESSESHFKTTYKNYLFTKSVLEIRLSFADKHLPHLTNEMLLSFYTVYFKSICEFEKIDFVTKAYKILKQYHQNSLRNKILYQARKLNILNIFILLRKLYFNLRQLQS